DGDRRFAHHRAVPYHASLGLAGYELGGGAARNQGMKAADRSAGDRDESKGKYFPRKNRAAAIDESGESRHVQCGVKGHDTQAEKGDRSQLHEGAEIIARGQQQPYRQSRGGKTIDDDKNRQGGRTERKHRSEHGVL